MATTIFKSTHKILLKNSLKLNKPEELERSTVRRKHGAEKDSPLSFEWTALPTAAAVVPQSCNAATDNAIA